MRPYCHYIAASVPDLLQEVGCLVGSFFLTSGPGALKSLVGHKAKSKSKRSGTFDRKRPKVLVTYQALVQCTGGKIRTSAREKETARFGGGCHVRGQGHKTFSWTGVIYRCSERLLINRHISDQLRGLWLFSTSIEMSVF